MFEAPFLSCSFYAGMCMIGNVGILLEIDLLFANVRKFLYIWSGEDSQCAQELLSDRSSFPSKHKFHQLTQPIRWRTHPQSAHLASLNSFRDSWCDLLGVCSALSWDAMLFFLLLVTTSCWMNSWLACWKEGMDFLLPSLKSWVRLCINIIGDASKVYYGMAVSDMVRWIQCTITILFQVW